MDVFKELELADSLLLAGDSQSAFQAYYKLNDNFPCPLFITRIMRAHAHRTQRAGGLNYAAHYGSFEEWLTKALALTNTRNVEKIHTDLMDAGTYYAEVILHRSMEAVVEREKSSDRDSDIRNSLNAMRVLGVDFISRCSAAQQPSKIKMDKLLREYQTEGAIRSFNDCPKMNLCAICVEDLSDEKEIDRALSFEDNPELALYRMKRGDAILKAGDGQSAHRIYHSISNRHQSPFIFSRLVRAQSLRRFNSDASSIANLFDQVRRFVDGALEELEPKHCERVHTDICNACAYCASLVLQRTIEWFEDVGELDGVIKGNMLAVHNLLSETLEECTEASRESRRPCYELLLAAEGEVSGNFSGPLELGLIEIYVSDLSPKTQQLDCEIEDDAMDLGSPYNQPRQDQGAEANWAPVAVWVATVLASIYIFNAYL